MLYRFNDSVRIFRTDAITPLGCGNKLFKLEGNLKRLSSMGCKRVLSFGGIWSNHLHALAVACESIPITPVAAVRGEAHSDGALLADAVKRGLEVHYIARKEYKQRNDEEFCVALRRAFECDAWLPEGGSNYLAVDGCREITTMINAVEPTPSHIVVAVGTGATLAGVICGAKESQTIIGIPVVKDSRVQARVEDWVNAVGSSAKWLLLDTAAPARYGAVDRALLEFVVGVHAEHNIVLDPVYNGKAFRALLASGLLDAGNDIVFIHTGGLGGALGLREQFAQLTNKGQVDDYFASVRAVLGLQYAAYQSGN